MSELAKIEDIQQLAAVIKDDWTLAGMFPHHEQNDLVAQTIHACRINFENHGEPFSFVAEDSCWGIQGGGIANYGGSLHSLISDEYFIEDKWEGKPILRVTQKLVDRLKRFLKIEETI